MGRTSTADLIISHLGGKDLLIRLGAHNFVIDETHVSFTLDHKNPKGVHLLLISIEPNGKFVMTAKGPIKPGFLTAPTLGRVTVDIPDNLAAVFGSLTGIEILKHRHL